MNFGMDFGMDFGRILRDSMTSFGCLFLVQNSMKFWWHFIVEKGFKMEAQIACKRPPADMWELQPRLGESSYLAFPGRWEAFQNKHRFLKAFWLRFSLLNWPQKNGKNPFKNQSNFDGILIVILEAFRGSPGHPKGHQNWRQNLNLNSMKFGAQNAIPKRAKPTDNQSSVCKVKIDFPRQPPKGAPGSQKPPK